MNIFIDGNIASGKSTLLNLIKPYFENFEFVQEPINEWLEIKNNNQNNILELFYSYKYKYAFSFQILTMITRLKLIQNQNQIIERSPSCDKNCFVQNCYNNGFIDDVEFKIYNQFYNYVNNKKQNNKFIYLKTSPNICLSRLLKRNRAEEYHKIDINYLNDINDLHDDFFKYTPHLVLDGNEDFQNNKEVLLKIVNQIKDYIK